jgi:ketosteroid isomerase-like protein
VSGRHLEERLVLAAPGVFRLFRRVLFTLPPGSPVRRRVLKRFAALGWDAFARGDFEASVIAFDPSYELNLVGDTFPGLGFHRRYIGHAGLREFGETWHAAWSSIEIHNEQLIDLGDRLVLRHTVTARGASSGAEVSATSGSSYALKKGTIERHDFYWDWADCTSALGLDRPQRS